MSSTHRRRLGFEPLEDRRLLTTITVNTLVDENNGIGVGGVSLREAVAAAAPGDTVNFSVTGTISLLNNAGTPGHIAIDKSLAIQGPGANLLTIKAFDPDAGGINNSNGRRVFVVSDNNVGTLANVTISGLTLTNGDPVVVDENDGGSAILNRENLTINSCVISGNFSPNGGAIYSTAGALSINDCTISGNSAGDGGAVLIQAGSLAIIRSKIVDNVATNSGGGVLARSVPVTIVDSTFSGNFSDEYGGGIYLSYGSLSISGTTISGNAADNNHDAVGSGGGIFNLTGSLSIVDSTISGNSAGEGGGGVFSNTGQTISIAHSTITGNVVPNTVGVYGGGINSIGNANLDHTIVAGNLRGASTRDDVSGTFNASYSLIGDKRSESVSDSGGSLIGTTALPIDAKLAPLANNGGLTLTHALQSGSPALEAGNAAAVAGVGTVPQFDQRGTPFSRVVDYDGVGGARIDIGAVEMAPSLPAQLGDYNLDHVVDAGDYVLWRKTTGGSVSQPYSGADGDGNSIVNSNDYTVWRSRFGNGGGGAGSSAEALQVESVSTESAGANVSSIDAVATAFALLANLSTVDSSPSNRIVQASPAIAIDSAIELLVALQPRDAVSDNRAADFGLSATEPAPLQDTSADQLLGGVEESLLAPRAPIGAM